jgi:hypothetical protein
MKTATRSRVRTALARTALLSLFLIAGFAIYPLTALQNYVPPTGVITGTVRSTAGPEAGVWVIAETSDLPTHMIKSVVTDDQGRYMVPELPNANYSVWVRGYGLADSKPVMAKPSDAQNPPALNLTAVLAKDKVEAAKVYPGNYWMQMLEPPKASAFPIGTTGPQQSLEAWMHNFKSSCNFCHQLGNPITRQLDDVFKAKPEIKTSYDAWDYRLTTGVRGSGMSGAATALSRPVALKMFSDWTDRIAKGETPAVTPPRPSGIERNVVITQWDWGTDHSFMHDQVSTSKQTPSLNGGGNLYAVSAGHGTLVVLNPKTNSTSEIEIPTRDERSTIGSRFPPPNPPSLWWGDAHLWNGPTYDPADPHNPMMDGQGRVWLTSKIRGGRAPAWCSDAKLSKYADFYPLSGGGRQASYYDPKTQKFQLIETCYSTHHLQFDNDANGTVFFNELSGPMFGWVDSKVYDQTLAATKDEIKAEQAAVGWCPQAIDANGDGKITKPWQTAPRNGFDNQLYVTDTTGGGGGAAAAATNAAAAATVARGAAAPAAAPAVAPPARGGAAPANGAPAGRGAPGGGGRGGGRGGAAAAAGPVAFDPTKDVLLANGGYSLYSLIPSPVDDSVWGVAETYPGYLIRLRRGNNPPETCLTELYKVPAPGLDPRGVDIDSNGVVWTALAASSHLASFDVRKCKTLNGTIAEKLGGTLCPEGWKLYQTDGPKFQGTNIPTEFHYFNWTDQKGASGFPPNTPMATGSNSDSIEVLLNTQQGTPQWVNMRVPYPLGFYARGLDARVDNPAAPAGFAGWKDRAVWSNYGTHFVWHIEGGKGTKGKEVKFQVRPNPLAR